MAGLVILLILLLGSFLGAGSELLVSRKDDCILNQLVFHATASTGAKEGGGREGGGHLGRGGEKRMGKYRRVRIGKKQTEGSPIYTILPPRYD